MPKLHELQEQRAASVASMRALTDKAAAESRDLTADEARSFDEAKGKVVALDKQIERAQALAEFERAAPAIVHGRVGDGQFEARARDFSIVKAIRSTMSPNDGGNVDIGFEREISQEVARRSGRAYQGIAVPDEVFLTERRTLTAGGAAADLVPNVHRADLFIDRLRAKLVCARLGATYLDGLIGSPIDLPRQTGSSSAQWVDEDGSLTETDASFDDVSFTSKTVGAVTSYSRRTLLNATPAIEQIVRNDLASVIANAIDEKAVLGDGSSNTPTGILNTGSVNTVTTGTSLTWDEVLSFIAAIESDSADEGSLAWLTSPWLVRRLRSTPKVENTDSVMIMESPNQLAGYPLAATAAMPGDAPSMTPTNSVLLFGNWASLMIGSWTGIDILSNPYETTAYAKGRVLVRAMKDVDVQIRHPESFAFSATLET